MLIFIKYHIFTHIYTAKVCKKCVRLTTKNKSHYMTKI
nr:MAG TPA: hypothetical protein [Bacteriophage sp.]DAE85400.1 MAG TPA: hypothetical protein [Bacteriophage sp.]